MRIVYLSADYGIPILGNKGGSVHVREMTRAFHELGHEVIAITPRAGRPGENRLFVKLIEVEVPALAGEILREVGARDGGEGKCQVREIRSLLTNRPIQERIEAIHRTLGVDLIYERHSLWNFSGMAAAEALGIPFLLEVNAPLSVEQERYRRLHMKSMARGIEEVLFRRADAVIAVSEGVRRYVEEKGVDPGRIHTVPNSVDTDLFDPAACVDGAVIRERRGLPAGDFIVGFLGTMKEWHGLRVLLGAMKEVWARGPGAHLLIVGNGPMRGWLEERIREDRLEGKITITGEVPHYEIPSYLAAMDVAVAPYTETPGFYFSPLKIFEYLAMGRPVIVSGIGQIREIVEDGETGLLARPGDVRDLAEKIGRLRDDPGRRERLGRAARSSILGRTHWKKNAREIISIVEETCGSRRANRAVPVSPIS
jgi:glycosyltransferase involved in cell wall biosynthesis